MSEFEKDLEKQRDRGKFGIRTSSTLKNNNYDSQYITGAYFKREGEYVLYSLNKGKLWQSIENLKIQIQSQTIGGTIDNLRAIITFFFILLYVFVIHSQDERREVIEIQSHAEIGEATAVVVGVNEPRHGGSFYYKEKRGTLRSLFLFCILFIIADALYW
jgi:hypothetical protein